jgi:DNA polymerase I-like protein with 3'-5' exonuclease and polymerase domains
VSAADAVLGPDGALQHPGQAFLQVAAAVKAIMEGAAPLAVPLRVKLAWGNSWGSLADLQL